MMAAETISIRSRHALSRPSYARLPLRKGGPEKGADELRVAVTKES